MEEYERNSLEGLKQIGMEGVDLPRQALEGAALNDSEMAKLESLGGEKIKIHAENTAEASPEEFNPSFGGACTSVACAGSCEGSCSGMCQASCNNRCVSSYTS